jgi:hypothetical protein
MGQHWSHPSAIARWKGCRHWYDAESPLRQYVRRSFAALADLSHLTAALHPLWQLRRVHNRSCVCGSVGGQLTLRWRSPETSFALRHCGAAMRETGLLAFEDYIEAIEAAVNAVAILRA